eukprot:s3840_g4.t1
MEVDPTEREKENNWAIGGMRNPHRSVRSIPRMAERGKTVRQFIRKALQLWPRLKSPARAILTSQDPTELPEDIVVKLRSTLVKTLWGRKPRPKRTARASTPISSEVLAGWSEDPDADTLARWLDVGAPMGFAEQVTTNGIFPEIPQAQMELETEQAQAKTLAGWTNYESAEQEAEELNKLVAGYVDRGLCHIVPTLEEATEELGRTPIINRLGVIVKEKIADNGEVVRKSRIIWDLRRSGANSVCSQTERIILPRLLDVAAHALEQMRLGRQCWDIKDAFLNVPVTKDRFALVAAKPANDQGDMELIIFNTLVFGAASAPTIWGRYAAFLGRTIAAIEPEVGCQIYVDDPIFTLTGDLEQATEQLATVLVWMAIIGYPVKLQKAAGGKEVAWIGAHISIDDEKAEVQVRIPQEKIQKLLQTTTKFLNKPVVGSRELRSYAGALSFIAGLIPHLRPFLASLWAVLPFNRSTTNDGAQPKGHSGRLVHVRRIRPALVWIKALLDGSEAPLVRTLEAFKPNLEVTITTDACPFGVGGTLRVSGKLVSAFASDLPKCLLEKFRASRGDAKHTTLWEAFALLYACRTWLPAFKGVACVRCKSDSRSLMYMLTRGKAKSADLSVIAREFAIDLAKGRYQLHLLRHIPGVTNVEADALSRVYAPIVPEMPAALQNTPKVAVNIPDNFWIVAT